MNAIECGRRTVAADRAQNQRGEAADPCRESASGSLDASKDVRASEEGVNGLLFRVVRFIARLCVSMFITSHS